MSSKRVNHLRLRPLAFAVAALLSIAAVSAPAVSHAALADSSGSSESRAEANPLLMELRLDDATLTDDLTGYQDGSQILLPLGELTRLLSLGITVNAGNGTASGFIIREDRAFGLNVGQSLVSVAGRESNFEAHRAQVIGDEIYVNAQLLSRWLPIDFDVNLSTLTLIVKPREKLPLQARLEREKLAGKLKTRGAAPSDPGYPRLIAPYRLIDQPVIDQTFGASVRSSSTSRTYDAAYTAYMTADVLGMEGAAYVTSTRQKASPDWRIILGRNDPDAGLLGPLHARSFALGNVSLPSVANVMGTVANGSGFTISNRPLDLPTSFDRQSLRGDLPPGWDVTLYYNDALIGIQQSRGDGLYAFDDLPLSFGRNEFQLVFNGPLGQMRTERKSFNLDQSVVKPGEFLYSIAQHYANDGTVRSIGKLDVGLTKQLAGSVGLFRLPRPVAGLTTSEDKGYAQLGLRGYVLEGIFTSEFTFAQGGGALGELGLKTKLGNFSLDLLHTQLSGGFDSDAFSAGSDPVRRREKLRLQGAFKPTGLPVIPVALDVDHEVLQSGNTNDSVSGRISATVRGTSITNAMSWQKSGGNVTTLGSLQVARRVAEMGLSAQLAYSIRPDRRLDTLAITADKNLASGYRMTAGMLHTFSGSTTLLTGGLSKNFGTYALALSGSYSSQHEVAMGLQLFVALGREPRTGKWFTEAVPLAGTGAVSARAFVDRNLNGVRDADEELVPNASFMLNGSSRHPSKTGEDGTAFIGRLPPGRYTDIALDQGTLEDPQWKSLTNGVRVLPRPGLVQLLEFPVVSTLEIDGTVSLVTRAGKRGIGDAIVQLVDLATGKVAMNTRSSSDGFYILHQVLPGRYALRISPEQALKLSLAPSTERVVDVKADGDFITGQDLDVQVMPK